MIRNKQINFWIESRLHQHIKIAAARKNITMNLWLEKTLLEAIERENNEKNISLPTPRDEHQ